MSDLLRRTLGENIAAGDDRRRRAVDGRGRRDRARDRAPQPRGQRARRHARRRQADHRDQQRLSRRRLLPPARRRQPGPIRADRGDRHRHRHAAGDDRARVRAVLHHQGDRQGHRPRPQPGLRLRQAVGRPREDLQRARARHDGQALPAALSTATSRRAPSTSRPAPTAAAARPSWSSRTTTTCAIRRRDPARPRLPGASRPRIRRRRCACSTPTSNSICCSPTWCCPARTAASSPTRSRAGGRHVKVLFTTGYSRNAIVHHGRLDPRHRADLQAVDRGRAGAQDPPGARRAAARAVNLPAAPRD